MLQCVHVHIGKHNTTSLISEACAGAWKALRLAFPGGSGSCLAGDRGSHVWGRSDPELGGVWGYMATKMSSYWL